MALSEVRFDAVVKILQDAEYKDSDHHLGKPFLTTYQIAIHIKQDYPDIYTEIDEEIGGKGHGVHHSLAQYLARQLSGHVKAQTPQDDIQLEGGFLSGTCIANLSYKEKASEILIEASLTPSNAISIFRIAK